MVLNIFLGFFFGFACSFIGLKSLVTEDEFKSMDITFKENKTIYIKNIIITGLGFYVIESFVPIERQNAVFLMSLFLIMASATDDFVKIVQDRIHIIASFSLIMVSYKTGNLKSIVIESLVMMVFMTIIYIFSRGKLGGADVKIFLPISLSVGLLQSIDTLLLASMITIVVGLFRKLILKKNIREWEFPFIPYIYIGYLLSCFINIYSSFLRL